MTAACSKDEAPAPGPFKSFEPAANNPATFTEPRDAVPLDDGAIAFLARSTESNRFAVFVIDAPGAAPRVLYKDVVAPFNIASNGKDTLYVADIGGGKDGQGAILQLAVAGGNATLLAEGYKPQGVATDSAGKIFFTGTKPSTGEQGVFTVSGSTATEILVGGQLKSPSGLDVDDDGTLYVADATAALNLEDAQVTGSGHGVVFAISGGAAKVITAGFNAGYPTGIAVAGGKVVISAYADRGSNSAVLIFDLAKPGSAPTVYVDKLKDTFGSAGLHRSRATGAFAWSGGDTVFVINRQK